MMTRVRGAPFDMLLYPSEHYRSRSKSEHDEAEFASHTRGRSGPIVNLLLAVCGIALWWTGEPQGALLMLVAMAAFNAGTMLRR